MGSMSASEQACDKSSERVMDVISIQAGRIFRHADLEATYRPSWLKIAFTFEGFEAR